MFELCPEPFTTHLLLNKISGIGVNGALRFKPNSLVNIGFECPIFSF